MLEPIKQDCPLCSEQAVFHYKDFEVRKYFNCPTCTRYLITDFAENRLGEDGHESLKEDLSRYCIQSPGNEVAEISLEGNETPKQVGAKYVNRSTIR